MNNTIYNELLFKTVPNFLKRFPTALIIPRLAEFQPLSTGDHGTSRRIEIEFSFYGCAATPGVCSREFLIIASPERNLLSSLTGLRR